MSVKSRKQHYFSGGTVPFSPHDNGSLLYTRYTDPSKIILNSPGSGKANIIEKSQLEDKSSKKKKEKKRKSSNNEEEPANIDSSLPVDDQAPAADGKTKKRKKPRWTEEKKEAARQEREAAGITSKGQKNKNKDKKKAPDDDIVVRKLGPEERISGPGNADEALHIRETFGWAPTLPKAENGAHQKDSHEKERNAVSTISGGGGGGGGGFSFQFDEKHAAAVVDTTTTTTKNESSSDKSSDDDDDDDNNKQQQQQQQQQEQQHTDAHNNTANTDDLSSEYVPRRVYVGGMPYGYSEGQIREFWEYCGAIESLDMLTFPDTGRFRGIVFITFATEEGYQSALNCNGEACDGQTVKVQRCKWSAKDKKARQNVGAVAEENNGGQYAAQAYQYADHDNNARGDDADEVPSQQVQGDGTAALRRPAPKTAGYNVAYVGNIAWEADEKAVKAVFEPYGVTVVRLHTDQHTGKPKGYAHVHFKDEDSLDKALMMDGTMLMGRRIKVGYAQPKKA